MEAKGRCYCDDYSFQLGLQKPAVQPKLLDEAPQRLLLLRWHLSSARCGLTWLSSPKGKLHRAMILARRTLNADLVQWPPFPPTPDNPDVDCPLQTLEPPTDQEPTETGKSTEASKGPSDTQSSESETSSTSSSTSSSCSEVTATDLVVQCFETTISGNTFTALCNQTTTMSTIGVRLPKSLFLLSF